MGTSNSNINKTLSESDCIENPCRCCRFKVCDEGSDSEVLNGCVNYTDTGSVTYLDCPGQPVEPWSFKESNLGALIITKLPNTDTISCNEQIVLSVDVQDARGNSIPEYVPAVTTENGNIVQITNPSKNVY